MEISSAVTTAPFHAILSALPALGVFIALFAVARARGAPTPWMVPGWLAAAALGPVIATFFGVRFIVRMLQGVTGGHGGIASASAAMFEATQPLLWTSYLAVVLAIATFFLALRRQRAGEPEISSRSTVVSIITIVTTFVALGATALLFHQTSRLIIGVLDPRASESIPGSDLPQLIASRLLVTSATAILMTILLIAAIVATALTARSHRPRPGIARALVLLSAIAILAFAASALMHRSWAATLYEAAMTGQFPR